MFLLPGLALAQARRPGSDLEGFRRLLNTVASGWTQGNPQMASACFAEDAIYEEPPRRQLYVGRQALEEFFHGADPNRPPNKMYMVWHHVAFEEASQRGYGEYTFRRSPSEGLYRHGIVSVQLKDGLIYRWREYQYQSDEPYEKFAAATLSR